MDHIQQQEESNEVDMEEVQVAEKQQVSESNVTEKESKREAGKESNKEPPKGALLYNNYHKGPFVVYIDKIGVTNTDNKYTRAPINPLELNAVLVKLNIKDIVSVSKIGYGRCKAECKSAMAANNILSSDLKK